MRLLYYVSSGWFCFVTFRIASTISVIIWCSFFLKRFALCTLCWPQICDKTYKMLNGTYVSVKREMPVSVYVTKNGYALEAKCIHLFIHVEFKKGLILFECYCHTAN